MDIGVIHTVTGDISPNQLGVTLMHEHVIVDYATNFARPSSDSSRCKVGGLSLEEQDELWDKPMCCEIAGFLRCYFNQNKDNMILDDVGAMADETKKLLKMGGKTIVECSSDPIGRNPTALAKVSASSGTQIVMGCGWYLERTHPKNMSELTVAHLANKMTQDISIGIDGVKAGLIGELGCSTNLSENEIKVLKAGVIAQKNTGAAITIHPGYSKESPVDVINILEKEGADLTRVVMGHIDRGILNIEDMKQLASRGVVLEFDQFGWGCSYTHALSYNITYPSDFERCKTIASLIQMGYGKQVVLAHDIAFKSRLTKFGGTGYDYLLRNCVPYLKQNC